MGVKTQLLISRLKELDEELDLDKYTLSSCTSELVHLYYRGDDIDDTIRCLIDKKFTVKMGSFNIDLIRDDCRITIYKSPFKDN